MGPSPLDGDDEPVETVLQLGPGVAPNHASEYSDDTVTVKQVEARALVRAGRAGCDTLRALP